MTDHPITTDTGPASDPVSSIIKALGGRPVLLPIEKGKKGPRFDGWQTITWEKTQDPSTPLTWSKEVEGQKERQVWRASTYGEELERVRQEGGNLGVLLGAASAAAVPIEGKRYVLCSIDVDADEAVEPFIALNPHLAGTLRTRARRGGNFWLWIDSEGYPTAVGKIYFAKRDGSPDKQRPWGEWRADGGQTVIWGTHPESMPYRRVSASASPARCAFSEIRWPEGLALPWEKTPTEKLVEKHGPGWFVSAKGAITLNPPYFVAKYAMEHETLFEPDEAAFYQYEEERGLWVKVSDDQIQWDLAADFKRMSDESGINDLLTIRTNTFLKNLVHMLRGATLRRDAFRREAGLIHLANCMLDIRDGALKTHPFSPRWYSRNQVPVKFDPEATCPRFTKELILSALSVSNADLLQRWSGSLLLGPNIMQRFALLYGTAGAGKSTLVRLLRLIVGADNCTQLRTKHLEERFELFFYVGKTLLIAPDVNGDFLQQDGAHVLKALVGGDPLSAERKQGGAAIQVTGDFHIAITCNSRLLIKLEGDADAFRRRMLPFRYALPKPAKRDPDFLSTLFSSEASGILNWMIAGAVKTLEEKRTHGDFVLTAEQQEEIDSLLAESDSVRHFVQHGVERSEPDNVTLHELGEAYALYCDAKGWRAETFKRAQTMLVDAVSEIWRITPRNDIKRPSGEGEKEKAQRGYKGLRVAKAAEPVAQEAAGDGDKPY